MRIHFIFMWRIINHGNHMKYYNFYDTTLSFILPLSMIIILNFITGYTVWKLANVRRTMTSHKRKSVIQSPSFLRGQHHQQYASAVTPLPVLRPVNERTVMLFENDMPPQSDKSVSRVKQTCVKSNRQALSSTLHMKVTKMLLFVSTVFVFLNFPSYVLRLMLFIKDKIEDPTFFMIGQCVAQQFFVTNFGINFILYCMSGQNFRKETINMFRRPAKNEGVAGTQVTIMEMLPSQTNCMQRARASVMPTGNSAAVVGVFDMPAIATVNTSSSAIS